MKELVTIIILLVVIRLSSYGVWNFREEKNITGAIGVGILDIAVIFQLATIVQRLI